jgi:thiamine-phosphate diphosphorylase
MKLPSPLYVILDQQVARQRDLGSLLEAILAGGCRLVQLRDKHTPLSELYAVARAFSDRCRQAGALFIVHVGQDDLPASVARRILPAGMVLGVSTHDPEQARRALADGADYVAVGSVFPTGTKAGFQLVGPDLVRKLRPEIPVPLVGIGGITADNAAQVIEAGADAVAVISAVCAADDPEAATRRLIERLGPAPSRPRPPEAR